MRIQWKGTTAPDLAGLIASQSGSGQSVLLPNATNLEKANAVST
jgi:hypothetical protein